MKSYYLTYLY
jgi:hypothetical protein